MHKTFTDRPRPPHLDLAMAMKSQSTNSQYAYSRSITTEASRSVGLRYTQLRDKLPPGFFAGRILDLQVLTATVFLLHSVYSHEASQHPKVEAGNTDDLDLVRKVTAMMDSVGRQPVGDVAKQGSKALKSMLDHFANPQAVGERTLTLRIPMLGKVHINRKPVQQPLPTPDIPRIGAQQGQPQMGNGTADIPGYFVPQDQNGQFSTGTTDIEMANSMGWSMDLLGDFPFMADDPYSGGDSWLWYNDWTTPPQPPPQ